MSYCQMNQVNQHLLCALCSGYLVDATAIIECLHTFCRSCIVRYLESSQTCPVCDVPLHENNPLLGIRSDVTLQRLVYKLVPDVYQEEVQRRFSFYKGLTDDGKTVSKEVLLKDIDHATMGHEIYCKQEMFSVSLRHSTRSGSDDCTIGEVKGGEETVETRYLLCPASLSVKHLKKLVTNKLDLPSCISESYQLNLFHLKELLADDYTLMDVAYIADWSRTSPLQVDYTLVRTSRRLTLNVDGKINQVTSKKKKAITNQKKAITNQYHATTVDVACRRFRLTGGKKYNCASSLHSFKQNKNLKVSHKTSSLLSSNRAEYKKSSKVSSQSDLSHKVMAAQVKADYNKSCTKIISLCKLKDNSNLSNLIIKSCSDNEACTKQIGSLKKKCSKERSSNTDSGSKMMNAPKIAVSCRPCEIKWPQKNIKKLANALEKAVSCTTSEKETISRKSALKSESNWQKKVTIAKTSNHGKVHVSNLNISKVSALKYLLVPKINLWKDRMSLFGLMRKHSKCKRLLDRMPSPCVDLSTDVLREEIVTVKPDIKDVVSSSSNCDSLMTYNDNFVSSSTSSSAGNEYDYDDEQVTSADQEIGAATVESVRLVQRSSVPVLDEVVQSDCKTSNEEDGTTLCVPIRLGGHGELLLRLPQNVSVECSFRPVTATSVLNTNDLCTELSEPVDSVACSGTSSQLEQEQSESTSSESDDNCNKLIMIATPSKSEDGSISTLPSQSVTASTDGHLPTYNANESSCVVDQPEISLFPFVTVSPSRRKLVIPSAVDSSQGGCTSSAPLVSSSLASPVDRSNSFDGLIMPRSPKQLAGVTRCEIIKVPVYMASFRGNKTLRDSQCVRAADVLDLSVSQTAEQPLEVYTPSKQTSEQRSCMMKSTSKTVLRNMARVEKPVKKAKETASLLEPKYSNIGVSFTQSHSISTKKTKLLLRRCDDICPAKSNTTTAPTTKRLKLMCNGITIYRTLEDSTDSKSTCRTGKHRSSHSKSFELQSNEQTCVSVLKTRQTSLPSENCTESTAPPAPRQTTRDAIIKGNPPVIESVDVVISNEPLELTTAKVQKRYKEKDHVECATALDLTVNTALGAV